MGTIFSFAAVGILLLILLSQSKSGRAPGGGSQVPPEYLVVRLRVWFVTLATLRLLIPTEGSQQSQSSGGITVLADREGENIYLDITLNLEVLGFRINQAIPISLGRIDDLPKTLTILKEPVPITLEVSLTS